MMSRRAVSIVAFVLALSFLPGCSLLGLAVGSQIPRYQDVPHATRGDSVYLEMDDGAVIHGAAVVVEPASLVVLSDRHERTVETQHIKRISRRHGTEWLSTFLIGLAVDSVVGVLVIVATTVPRSTVVQ